MVFFFFPFFFYVSAEKCYAPIADSDLVLRCLSKEFFLILDSFVTSTYPPFFTPLLGFVGDLLSAQILDHM